MWSGGHSREGAVFTGSAVEKKKKPKPPYREAEL